MPKALPRFQVSEIDFMLDSGEIPTTIITWFEEAVKAAKESPDGDAPIQAFVVDDSQDETDLEEAEDG